MAARTLLPGAAVVALVALAGCGGDDGGDQEAFCGDLQENLSAVVSPTISSGDGADEFVALLRELGAKAPLAVEEDWEALVLAHEAANAVVPGDEESEQLAAAAAYAMEQSAIAVKAWVQTNCGFDMGPVVTVGDAPPPTTTTIPGQTTVVVPTSPTTTSSP